MLTPGLCSVTFRKLAPEQVIAVAREAGLKAIEWGGDVHVPPGDVGVAREVRERTEDAGLVVSSYGSYYRAGVSPAAEFDLVLTSARELGAPTIRVWAGTKGSKDATAEDRRAVAADLNRVTALAAAADVIVATEHHDGTLTDELESALALLEECPGTQTYWQPPHRLGVEGRLDSLRRMLPRVVNVHVFHWLPKSAPETGHDFRPLAEGREAWKRYLSLRGQKAGGYALLEFVREESAEQLIADAATLMGMLRGGG